MRAQLIDTEDGEQIVVFPPGFEIDASGVELTLDGDCVVLTPAAAAKPSPMEA